MLALVGPTATGKTGIALTLAPELGAEVVAVDSMTVYRRLDIGTAKPTPAERARVPHHLIDVFEPGTRPTVAAFQALARAAIDDVVGRGRTPVLVGGSGLYFRAAVDDLSFPPTDPAVRARLEREDPSVLAAWLAERDPAADIDPRNVRRVVRALEVIELTGRPFSSFREAWARYGDCVVAGLEAPADALRARIEARLRAMLDAGFLDEVRSLLDDGLGPWLERLAPVGYVEAMRHLAGELALDGFLDEAARATARLARRQRSWFRADPRVRWFDATEPERAVSEIRAYYGASEGVRWSS